MPYIIVSKCLTPKRNLFVQFHLHIYVYCNSNCNGITFLYAHRTHFIPVNVSKEKKRKRESNAIPSKLTFYHISDGYFELPFDFLKKTHSFDVIIGRNFSVVYEFDDNTLDRAGVLNRRK